MKQLSLRPYPGKLFVANSRKDYEKSHKKLFKEPDILNCSQAGRMSGGEGKDGMWTYLIWGGKPHNLAHEVSHVVLEVFKNCGIDPREAGGEPFCYLLGQIMLDAKS